MAQELTREQMIADIRAEMERQQARADEKPNVILLAFQAAAQLDTTLSTRMVARIVGREKNSVQGAMADLSDAGLIEWADDVVELNRARKKSRIPHYQLVVNDDVD